MYATVIECLKMDDKTWMVELKLDQQGLKANSILSSLKTSKRWVVENRVLYAQLRSIHKKFPFERHKIIRLDIPEGDIEKLKIDLCKREDAGIFQYIIKGTAKNIPPEINEQLLCAGY